MMPEAVESVILAVAAGWFAWLSTHRRTGGATMFAAAFLGVPAIGLGLQAAGFLVVAEWAKWAVVAVNAGLTAAMIVSTRRADSTVVRALVDAERDRRRIELRARAYACAEIVLAQSSAA